MAEDEFSAGAASIVGLFPNPANDDLVFPEGFSIVGTSPDGTLYRLDFLDGGGLATTDLSIVGSDSFTRANQTPLGTPDVGPAWVSLTGTGLSVISNTAGAGSTSTFLDAMETGLSDKIVTVTCAVAGTIAGTGVILRATDADNYLRLDHALGRLWERVAGVEALLGTLANEDVTDSDVLTFTCDGTDVNVKRNGVSELTRTTSLTGTLDGLRITGSTAPRYDDFEVRTL